MNKKEVRKQEDANRLIKLLHANAVPYNVYYTNSHDQRDGEMHKWVFEFDSAKLIDVLLKS